MIKIKQFSTKASGLFVFDLFLVSTREKTAVHIYNLWFSSLKSLSKNQWSKISSKLAIGL